uniref:Uncharacterized protein n=1 Tax=Theileria annulata TaxID=5874 RepID=A0A3B0N001_THEAN
MIDSKGSAPSYKASLDVIETRYAYAGWFLLGILPTFGIVMNSISSRVHYSYLEVPEDNSGLFESNLLSLTISFSCLGLLVAYVFCPVSIEWLLLSIIMSVIMTLLIFISLLLPIILAKPLYVISLCICCFFLGMVELISLTSIKSKFIRGEPRKKMFFFLLGHPQAYLLVILISTLLECSSFGGEDYDFIHELIVFDMYQLLVMMIMVIPILVVVYYYVLDMRTEHYKWDKTNIFNNKMSYKRSIRMLVSRIHYAMLLIVTESSEAFFNSVIVLFLVDPFPHFNKLFKTLLIFVFHEIFDLVGRLIYTGVKCIISQSKRETVDFSQNYNGDDVEVGELKEKVVVNLATNSIGKIAEITYKKLSSKSMVGLFVVWSCLIVRIAICFCMFFQRHFRDVRFLNFIVTFPMALSLTIFNSLVRGLVVSYVYIKLAEIKQNKYTGHHSGSFKELHGPNEIRLSSSAESEECLDITGDPVTATCLLIGLFRVIEILPYIIWNYIGFKYNRILFECELILEQSGSWPTDGLESNCAKFLWWLKMIFRSILHDITDPFGNH